MLQSLHLHRYEVAIATARYKNQERQKPATVVVLCEQIVPGCSAFALHHLVDHELDITTMDARPNADEVGVGAYPETPHPEHNGGVLRLNTSIRLMMIAQAPQGVARPWQPREIEVSGQPR